MLDHILRTACEFEKTHGVAPDVIYISPLHYEALCKYHYSLFCEGVPVDPGFRLVILPGSVLSHPVASLLPDRRGTNRVA